MRTITNAVDTRPQFFSPSVSLEKNRPGTEASANIDGSDKKDGGVSGTMNNGMKQWL